MVDQLVDHENNSSHVVNQALSFDVVLEHVVKALVDRVQYRGKNQLIVVSAVAKHINRHIRVASEDGYIVLDVHDVILVHIQLLLRGLSSLLLVGLSEQLALDLLLLGVRLEAYVHFLVVVLGDDTPAFVVEDDDSLDVSHHVWTQHFYYY